MPHCHHNALREVQVDLHSWGKSHRSPSVGDISPESHHVRGDARFRFNHYNMPESLSAFWRIVSLTAANTNRMLVVSVACVKLNIVSHDLELKQGGQSGGLTEGIGSNERDSPG